MIPSAIMLRKPAAVSGDEHVAAAEDAQRLTSDGPKLSGVPSDASAGRSWTPWRSRRWRRLGVRGVEVVALLEADPDDLPAVAGVAPGVVPEIGVEPEVEVVGVEGTDSISWNFWPTQNQGMVLRSSSGTPSAPPRHGPSAPMT